MKMNNALNILAAREIWLPGDNFAATIESHLKARVGRRAKIGCFRR